jgi:hypothetical protein
MLNCMMRWTATNETVAIKNVGGHQEELTIHVRAKNVDRALLIDAGGDHSVIREWCA